MDGCNRRLKKKLLNEELHDLYSCPPVDVCMPLSSVQQCIKEQEFYTQLYWLTASYKQNLDSRTFWQSCYRKYAKKLGLEKMLMGHYKIYNTVLIRSIPWTPHHSSFYTHVF